MPVERDVPVIAIGDDLGGRPDRAVAAGRARQIVRGLYTTDMERPLEQVVRDHLWEIVGKLIPDALITDRSAGPVPLEGNTLFVVSAQRARDISLPGLRVAVRDGVVPLDDDPPWPGGLRRASIPRALVENLAPSRRRGSVARTLSDREMADWMALLAQQYPPDRLNRFRDRARELAPRFGQAERIDFLDDLFGAALGTRPQPVKSTLLSAQAAGRAWDVERLATFEQLVDQLQGDLPDEVPPELPVIMPERLREQPFFEAYLSNFIEGTEFELDEAIRVVYEGAIPHGRPADAHDVVSTYELITDIRTAHHVPVDDDDLVNTIMQRHRRLMAARPELHPGEFKAIPNRVGSYDFVSPELTEGTLRKGYGLRDALDHPFARAVFVMFLISEVHPFDDGNGRLARLAMNAELSSARQHRILVPIISRNDYLNGLRRLSRDQDPNLLCRVLATLWRWSSQVDYSDLALARVYMDRTNALVDPTDAEGNGLHLTLPADLHDPEPTRNADRQDSDSG